MKTASSILGCLHCLLDYVILFELSLLDYMINADDILPDDTASTNVEMPNFGVAHQALGKADGKRRSIEFREPIGTSGEFVHHGGLRGSNGISILGGFLGWDAPTVNHD